MHFDEVLEHLGEMGRYQWRMLFFVGLPILFVGMETMAPVFLAAVPHHRCFVPGCDDPIDPTYSAPWLNGTIPWEMRDGAWQRSQCDYYAVPSDVVRNCSVARRRGDADDKPRVATCDRWVYDTSIYAATVTTEFDVVCGREWLMALSQAMFMAGILVGNAVFGSLSDKYGRKPLLFVALVLMVASGVGSPFTTNIYAYTAVRFLVGMGCSMFAVAFILGVEMCGPSKRLLAGMLGMYWFALSYLTLAGVAYFFRDWKQLSLIISCPAAIFFGFWWLIPESVRWLISQGRMEEAEAIVRKVAVVNRVRLPDSLFDSLEEETERDHMKHKDTILDLFRSRVILLRTIALGYVWFVNSLVYYGLSLNTNGLGGDPYVDFILIGAVEIPSYTFCLLTLDRLGRRPVLCLIMLLGGAACILVGFIPEDLHWLTVTLAMVGKFGISGSFASIFIYTGELLPTPLRSTGTGIASMMARVGGIVSPFAVMLVSAGLSLS
ncbi:PREDICTED: organic cation transporter protein-like, partial [Priapulus caudatus]|uniref:Organic cation transporter protein-like n=1 Tax=Priapulus caudatus TaxID=37621 RepID=A0ABM1EDJ6_PRICU